MATVTVSLEEYQAEKARAKMSVDEKLNILTASNEQLDSHIWTDQQIRDIPAALLQFAWDHSASLRKEFVNFGVLLAYLNADRQGRVRIAARRQQVG